MREQAQNRVKGLRFNIKQAQGQQYPTFKAYALSH